MKKTLHRVGATALTVATITTGLSSGPASVAAPAASTEALTSQLIMVRPDDRLDY